MGAETAAGELGFAVASMLLRRPIQRFGSPIPPRVALLPTKSAEAPSAEKVIVRQLGADPRRREGQRRIARGQPGASPSSAGNDAKLESRALRPACPSRRERGGWRRRGHRSA